MSGLTRKFHRFIDRCFFTWESKKNRDILLITSARDKLLRVLCHPSLSAAEEGGAERNAGGRFGGGETLSRISNTLRIPIAD